jgi:hypothetical protein
VTAPGPLARKLAEVEAERDAALAEVERLRARFDSECHHLEALIEVTAERDQLRDRATRYAESLARINNKMGHHHTDTCHEKYVACEAARWLTERAP